MYEIVVGRTESDRKKLGLEGTIFVGKLFVKMGQTTSLSNKVLLDVARSHVVLVSGKRGSGKCLHGDTLIQLDNGEQIPIKDLKERNENVYSLNKNLKIQETNKTDFFERKVKKLVSLKLRSGKEIKLTPEHPLLTIKGWIPAQELNLKDKVATPRKIPSFGKYKLENYKIKILAYLIAEGHLSNGFVLFSNSDKKIIKEFKESINFFDDNLRVDKHSKSYCFRISQKKKRYAIKEFKRNSKRQFIDNNIIYEKASINKWLRKMNMYGKFAVKRVIPNIIMQLPEEKLKIFLNRLFSCDGSIYYNKYRNGWEINYSSSSKKLINQMHNLLLRFSILSKIRKKYINYKGKRFELYEIILNTENTIKFIDKIGFYGEKEEKQKKCLKETIKIKRNPNINTIPREIWEVYRTQNWVEIGKKFDYSIPKSLRSSINYFSSRQKLLQITIADQNEKIKLIAQSDIFWDEIVSMEILEGDFKVYDITVPETHNFIANDIIVHNSYSLGVIAEEISNLPKKVAQNLSVLIFDTMGIFWTMKYNNEKDADLLEEWELKPEAIKKINIFVPKGVYEKYKNEKFPADFPLSIKPSELSSYDWSSVFDIELTNPVGVLIERMIEKAQENFGQDYSLDDIISLIRNDKKSEQKIKDAAENRFANAKSWGLFSKRATPIKELVDREKVSVVDISVYKNWNIKCLVVSLICKKLLLERMVARKLEELRDIEKGYSYFEYKETEKMEEMPLVWILIDEAHEFLPRDKLTPATDTLVQLLREGRQPGISMILATQQPGEIHTDVITQSDIVLSHRITAKRDIEALNNIMQTYLSADIVGYMNDLPRQKGSAIILDDNSERIYPVKIRPRYTWHGGEAPTAVHPKKEELIELGF